jgi:carbon-monoxide dehydrogenase medium subunit
MTYYRRLPKFDYVAPNSISEVSSLLMQHKGDARLFAGGTIVLHQMKERIGVRPFVIGLKGVAGLNGITFDENRGLAIGSMVSLQEAADSDVVKGNCPLLAMVCGRLGTPQIRNMGTIGGNVAIRFATSETLPALIALKAQARLVGAGGERVVPVEELYKEMKTDDFLTGLEVPVAPQGFKVGYKKFAVRERFDYATVAAAVGITMDGKTCKDVTIGLGGVTLPTMRAKSAEEMMRGQSLGVDLIEKVGQAAAQGGRIGADVMFSAEYKAKVLKVMVQRAIKEAAGGF